MRMSAFADGHHRDHSLAGGWSWRWRLWCTSSWSWHGFWWWRRKAPGERGLIVVIRLRLHSYTMILPGLPAATWLQPALYTFLSQLSSLHYCNPPTRFAIEKFKIYNLNNSVVRWDSPDTITTWYWQQRNWVQDHVLRHHSSPEVVITSCPGQCLLGSRPHLVLCIERLPTHASINNNW